MFDGQIEDLTLATMADYDRLVSRHLLQREAQRVASAERELHCSPARRFPWTFEWRTPRHAT